MYRDQMMQVKLACFVNGETTSITHKWKYCCDSIHCSQKKMQGHQPFASYESLEQLHRLLIVLAVVHVSYSFCTVALAMFKVHLSASFNIQAILVGKFR